MQSEASVDVFFILIVIHILNQITGFSTEIGLAVGVLTHCL